MRRSQVPSIGNTARQAAEPPSQHARPPRRRLAQAWRQSGVVLVSVLSDALLAVLVWLADDLAQLAARLKQVEREIAAVLSTIPDSAVLTAQIGVGLMTAAAVLAYLPAGVHGHAKAAAAYAGLHPRQEQSGQRARSRLSKQGCPAVRRYLYLAAQCAVRCDPIMKRWYAALCARGKAPQSAICAVAHKLLRQMMGRLRQARTIRMAARVLPDQVLPLAA